MRIFFKLGKFAEKRVSEKHDFNLLKSIFVKIEGPKIAGSNASEGI